MPPITHAVCAPSSAKRWIHCPPSAVDNAKAERRDTVFTREGTLAHAVAEAKARHALLGMSEEDYRREIAEAMTDELWQDEMDGHTDFYIECLRDFVAEFRYPPLTVIEKKLTFDPYVPGSFGTADCVIIGPESLHVVDFKYGKGVAVSAENNEQMRIYALGCLAAYGELADFKSVKMSIVQPRISREPSTWECPVSDLIEWAETVVKPAAILAAKGGGSRCSGDWCRWCVNDGKCRAQLVEFMALEDYDYELPPVLTDGEVAKAIELADRLGEWLNSLKAYALERCMDGGEIPGWKAVEGRSTRRWTDEHAAFEAAKKEVPEELLYERVPISLSSMEKLMGAKRFREVMKPYVEKPAGSPKLAPANDKRDAITKATTVEDDFGGGDK